MKKKLNFDIKDIFFISSEGEERYWAFSVEDFVYNMNDANELTKKKIRLLVKYKMKCPLILQNFIKVL